MRNSSVITEFEISPYVILILLEKQNSVVDYPDFANNKRASRVKRPQSGRYETTFVGEETVRAFVPSTLPPEPALDLVDLVQLIAHASTELGRLDAVISQLPDPDLLVYSYIRREAVLSSQIEGTQSSLSDLLRHEIEQAPGLPIDDDVTEVSNYVAALNHGFARMRSEFPLSNRLIREMHGLLLQSGRGSDKLPGEFRRTQNWIGGRRPGQAIFVPPPQHLVQDCMGDMERFIHAEDDGLPALVRAGLVHAQFETIHPFLDGNGRIGRMLIAFVLHQAGILSEPILYLSLYFKQQRTHYYSLLNQLREDGDWEAWLRFFLEGVAVTARDGVETVRKLNKRFETDRATITAAKRRTGSALRAHEALKQRPILSIQAMQQRTQMSYSATASAVEHLAELGIAQEITGRRRGRLFAYGEYIDILSEGAEPL